MMPHRSLAPSGLLLIMLALSATSCASTPTSSPPPSGKSLYDRLGGKPAITAVVDQFVANVAADSRINKRFATTDIPRLKGQLVDQICMVTGGPCVYTGRDMRTAHAGMKISTADFNALVEDLVKALDHFKVPERERQELLGLLSPMKTDIVEIP
jgi:hemoglobin